MLRLHQYRAQACSQPCIRSGGAGRGLRKPGQRQLYKSQVQVSRGASGMWIENGEPAYPVEEITVAGNLGEMFSNLAEIGSDLIWRGSVACPTLRIEGMTIAGE